MEFDIWGEYLVESLDNGDDAVGTIDVAAADGPDTHKVRPCSPENVISQLGR